MDTEKMPNREPGQPQKRIVCGYLFATEQEAALAEQEHKKIEYLEERMNYDAPATILSIYRKAIRERIFKTPLGIDYLKQLQDYLQNQPELAEEEIPPIPLRAISDGKLRDSAEPARKRIQPSSKKEYKSAALPMSIILNIAMAIAMIAMFVITLNTDQPNILNYERAITDRYAAWEQELTEREQIIREKERSLKIGETQNAEQQTSGEGQ